MAALLALALMLTTCSNGGDNPTGDNSTPGASSTPNGGDNNTPGTSNPTTADNTAGSGYNFTKLSQFTPELKTPSMDISKYFSANGTEFDIVQCARMVFGSRQRDKAGRGRSDSTVQRTI